MQEASLKGKIMKKAFVLIGVLFVTSCGGSGLFEAPQDGTSCSVSQADGGMIVSCEDGTEAFISHGQTGSSGENGTDGQNGSNGIDGADGSNGLNGVDGEDGQDGINGTDGSDGADGEPGENGTDGLDGVDGDIILHNYIVSLADKSINIVDIWVADAEGNNLGRCTGTKTSAETIITAKHCFPDAAVNYIYYQNGVIVGTFGDENYYGSVGRDIVEVTGISWSDEGKLIPGLTTTAMPVMIGDLVGNLSLPLMIYNDVQVTTGFVTDENLNGSIPDLFWEDSFMADYAAAGGSSGSPVFNQDGDWIGIHVGGFYESLELSIALPFKQ